MSPLIKEGNKIIVDIRSSTFSIGDIIIVMDKGHELICHRVISKSPLVTKGDRSLIDDQTQSIVGVVTHIQKGQLFIEANSISLIKYIQVFLSQKNRLNTQGRRLFLVLSILLSLIEIKIAKKGLRNHTL